MLTTEEVHCPSLISHNNLVQVLTRKTQLNKSGDQKFLLDILVTIV